ncbi:MAG: monovalent cation/H(+) antiporter subunit G [Granulosicoccus sp.]
MVDIPVLLLSWILMAVGCVFIVSGAVGLVRMPDLYTRLHASSLTDTGGTLAIGLALILQALFVFDNNMAAIKMTMIVFFTLFTSPTASHALAKTALLCGQAPVDVDGEPIVASAEEATQLARSRPTDYQHGQDARLIDNEMEELDNRLKGKS